MSNTNSTFLLEAGRQSASPMPYDQYRSPSIAQHQHSASEPPETSLPKGMSRYREAFLDVLASAMRERFHSDLLIVCDGARYNVHKLIVCSQSMWFAERVNERERFGIDSGIETEGDSVKILVPLRFLDETIRCIVSFLYSQDYECGCGWVADAMMTHVRVLDAASHFEIPLLTDLAKEKFHALLPAVQKNLILYGMMNVIMEVYRLPSELTATLRKAFVQMAADCPQELHGPTSRAWILQECAPQEFVADLVTELAKKLEAVGERIGGRYGILGLVEEKTAEENADEWTPAKEGLSEKSVDGE